MLCLGLIHYILTVRPSIPMNGGLMRSIRTHAPPGTLLNADMPAAMGNRWVTAMRGYDTQIGCLNQAVPGGIAACGAGQARQSSASPGPIRVPAAAGWRWWSRSPAAPAGGCGPRGWTATTP